jgi:hypothetical protein
MPRDRSPNYPAISLPTAIDRAWSCWSTIGRGQANRTKIASSLGYGSENGSALSAISAELKFGLLAKTGDSYKLTGRAISILVPKNKREKAQAIWNAATTPAIFVELIDTFPGIIPDSSEISRYLLRRGYGEVASKTVSETFRETLSFVFSEAHGYAPPIENAAGRSPQKRITASSPALIEIAPPESETESMRVTVTETGVEVSAILTTAEGIDRLMRTLQATRPLIAAEMVCPNGKPKLRLSQLNTNKVEGTKPADWSEKEDDK